MKEDESPFEFAEEVGTSPIEPHRGGSGHAAFCERQRASIDDETDGMAIDEKDGPQTLEPRIVVWPQYALGAAQRGRARGREFFVGPGR
jgi:hypothetical protein